MRPVTTTHNNFGGAITGGLKHKNFYESLLAVLGLELEARNFGTFLIDVADKSILVKSKSEVPVSLLPARRGSFWQRIGLDRQPQQPSKLTELCFGIEELGQITMDPGRHLLAATRLADFLRLAHQLAAVGEILDRKGARLIGLHRRAPDGLAAQFEDDRGDVHREEYSSASLYGMSVRLYMQEKRRSEAMKNRSVAA